MTEAFLYFIAGTLSGLASSVSIGPTTLWLAQAKLDKSKPTIHLILFICGIIFMDVLYAFIGLWGYFLLVEQSAYYTQARNFIGGGMIALALLEIKSSLPKYNNPTPPKNTVQKFSSSLTDLGTGLLYGANPAFIAFWIICGEIMKSFNLSKFNGLNGSVFLLGIIFADILFYGLYCKLIAQGLKKIPIQFVSIIRFTIGVFLILIGLNLIVGII